MSQLREQLAHGVLTPQQMAEHTATAEQLQTLRESNAHLRTRNRELEDTAARREREAREARAQLQPLQSRLSELEVSMAVERERAAKAAEAAQRAESSLQRVVSRSGVVDAATFEAARAEADSAKVGAESAGPEGGQGPKDSRSQVKP